MPILLCIFLILLFIASPVNASPLSVRHLGIDQGLPNNSVRSIYQDHEGFMWFGTFDGLSRYDGYQFKVFRNQLDDSTSLPHNYIYTIHEDARQQLWVGTGQGAVIYNPLTENFKAVYYRSYSSGFSEKLTTNVSAIQPDATGNTFIGTNGSGLLLQRAGTTELLQLPVLVNGIQKTTYFVTSIIIHQSKIWLFINDIGLCSFNYQSEQIERINSQLLVGSRMVSIGNDLWVGSNSGLYVFNKNGGIEKSYTEANDGLSSNVVTTLATDQQGQLWIGTEGSGIDILPTTATPRYQQSSPGPELTSLTSKWVLSIFVDRENRKWIGTVKGGVEIVDPQQSPFQTISHSVTNANSLVNNFVSCFSEGEDSSLLVGTDGGGLSIWNRRQNTFTNYTHQPANPTSISNNLATSIARDSRGTIWIATYGGGINRFDQRTGSFKKYNCFNPKTGRENINVWLLYNDRQQTLWATTFSQGALYRYNRATDHFDVYNTPGAGDFISFMQDNAGQLWAGNAYHLYNIDRVNGHTRRYEIGKPVRAIFEDSKKRLWLGTEGGGLILFNRQTAKIERRYSTKDGLSNNAVLNILEDTKGQLWLSTFYGLSAFSPQTGSFKNYFQSDGLQSNQFSYNAALRLQTGEMAFGGINGFSIFAPSHIHITTGKNNLQLTGITLNNEPVANNIEYITRSANTGVLKVRVPYDKASLFFDFAVLQYTSPDKISYAYYLEGWDKSWNYTGKLRTASYSRLKEGTYTLHVKATNIQGDWQPEETLLTLTVLPPWYRTGWAYLLYACIVAALIYLYNNYRVRQARLETEVKLANLQNQKDKELAQMEIRREKELAEKEREMAQLEIQKEKELSEKKLSFFTDISHEFRTPLTLIINPLKDFVKSGRKAEPEELNMVQRNASRLLRLVEQLLQFQKAGSGTDKLKVTKTDFCSLCREVFESFEGPARKKKLNYHFECDGTNFDLYTDRDKMEIVLFNLLSNAVKYTPENGHITFSIREKENEVVVCISDTGPGIPGGIGDKLFERFYQVKEARSVSKPGFGIGLYLVKHFVELHKGTISYESQYGSGTVFKLSILKGKSHFEPETLIEEQPEQPTADERATPGEALKQYQTVEAAKPGRKEKNLEPEELFSGKLSLLIVEDDADIRQYIVSIFEGIYNVYQAIDGETGIRLAKTYLPELIISDVMMPNGTGIDLCNAIKQDAALSHIPVILLTAASSTDMKLKGLEGGADDYITKPFEKELLVARVANLVKRRTTLQNYFYNEVTLQQNDVKVSAEYKLFLEKCIQIVEAHLTDEKFNIQVLAREIGMSHSNLYKKVKSISGQSVNSFIRFIRLRKGAELLINTDMNVNETSFEVGILDVKYFRKHFNQLFGINPSDFIKKYRKPFSERVRVNRKAFGNSAE